MRLTVIDAFTDTAFTGNPAAVALLDAAIAVDRMAMIAREMNLSETAFVVARPDGDFDLRWFTPTDEIDLCGHATLASAHALGGDARFHTRSGLLSCERRDDERIEMDFPLDIAQRRVPIDNEAHAIGLDVVAIGSGKFAVVEVASAAEVRSYAPDMAAISALHEHGVIITAPGDRPGIDCVSRVFVPNLGVPEDPVTGAAHCVLASWWGEQTGQDDLTGEQASTRGGIVGMRRCADRVKLIGQAITVAEVTLLV
ncbi:MAG: PhzF family phenazine biosynthesis protein [Acidimicrobiia bacterium]